MLLLFLLSFGTVFKDAENMMWLKCRVLALMALTVVSGLPVRGNQRL